MSEYKDSFMLDTDHLDDFIQHIESIEYTEAEQKKHQILHVYIDDAELYVSKSGVVVYEKNKQLLSVLSNFITTHKLDIALAEYNDEREETTTGWKETPKGVWLLPEQLEIFIELLDKSDYIEEINAEKNEIARYQRNEEILVINNNSIVYTIGGFDNIMGLMEKAIDRHNPYLGIDSIIAIDEQGKWSRIGPVVVASISINGASIKDLQLRGVKDSSLSRDLDYKYFQNSIDDQCKVETLIITPEQINEIVNTRESYMNYLTDQTEMWLTKQELKADEIVVTKSLSDLIEADRIIDERNSIPLAIASIVAQNEIEKWKKQQYKEYLLELNRNNITKIREHDARQKFLKLFL